MTTNRDSIQQLCYLHVCTIYTVYSCVKLLNSTGIKMLRFFWLFLKLTNVFGKNNLRVNIRKLSKVVTIRHIGKKKHEKCKIIVNNSVFTFDYLRVWENMESAVNAKGREKGRSQWIVGRTSDIFSSDYVSRLLLRVDRFYNPPCCETEIASKERPHICIPVCSRLSNCIHHPLS